MAGRTPWTDEAREKVRELWARGDTAGAIARAIGRTHGSVIGMVHRMRLAARPSPIKKLAPGEIPKRQKKKARSPAKIVHTWPGSQPPALPLPDMSAEIPPVPKRDLDLPPPTTRYCQFIAVEKPRGYTDADKCGWNGTKAEHGVYCREHYLRTIDWKNTARARAKVA